MRREYGIDSSEELPCILFMRVVTSIFGETRSTLNRALHSFESLGLITVDGNQITLIKPVTLATYTW